MIKDIAKALAAFIGVIFFVVVLLASMVWVTWVEDEAIREYRDSYTSSINGTVIQAKIINYHRSEIYWRNENGEYYLTILEVNPKSIITMPAAYQPMPDQGQYKRDN